VLVLVLVQPREADLRARMRVIEIIAGLESQCFPQWRLPGEGGSWVDTGGDVAEAGVGLNPHDVFGAFVGGVGHVVGQVGIAWTTVQFNLGTGGDKDVYVATLSECLHIGDGREASASWSDLS
jgi:hypothetical protein